MSSALDLEVYWASHKLVNVLRTEEQQCFFSGYLFLLLVDFDLIGGFWLNVRICLIRLIAFGQSNYNALESFACRTLCGCLEARDDLTMQV